jgi:hypothetical protein
MRLQSESPLLLTQLDNSGKKIALPECRGVVSFGNLDNQWFVDAFCLEVLSEALTQQRSVHSNDVVRGCVVLLRSTEDLMSQFEFVDVVHRFIEHPVTEVEKQIPQTGRFANHAARYHSINDLFASLQLAMF